VAVLSGDDAATLAVLAMGGDGVISVASNEIPGEMSALVRAWHAGDWAEARRLHDHWLPLMRANFQGGPNPVPAKAAMFAMGLLDCDATRQPLLPLADAPRERLTALLRSLGLVDGGGRMTETDEATTTTTMTAVMPTTTTTTTAAMPTNPTVIEADESTVATTAAGVAA
jgi:Dihydrodipicolinate synthetase family